MAVSKIPKVNKFEILSRDFELLTNALLNDIVVIKSQFNEKDTQTWRRLYVKSMASILETQLSFLKKHIVITGETDYLGLSQDEEDLLNSNTKKYSFTKDLILTIELFSSVNCSFIKVDKTSKAYQDLVALIKIRNRITHPKELSDITVNDIEIKKCQNGFNSFQDLFIKVFYESANALLEIVAAMSKSFGVNHNQ